MYVCIVVECYTPSVDTTYPADDAVMSGVCVVSTVTGLDVRRIMVRFPAGTKYLSLLQSVQTGCAPT